MALTVVTGPPCSGKSTYARERAQPGDILIDFDTLAQALGSPDPHNHPDQVRWVTLAARRAAIDAAVKQHHLGTTVWIVQTRINRADMARYVHAGADVVTLTADAAELHARADRERPALCHRLIDEWTPPPDLGGRVDPLLLDAGVRRGRTGRPWRRVRRAVLAGSTVCWICGHEGADSVDHVTPLSHGGDPLDGGNLAPAHHRPCATCGRRCNTARGNRPGRDVTQRDPREMTWSSGSMEGRARLGTVREAIQADGW